LQLGEHDPPLAIHNAQFPWPPAVMDVSRQQDLMVGTLYTSLAVFPYGSSMLFREQ